MINKKTLVLAVSISWALTFVTVLLISNFIPYLSQSFSQQTFITRNVKVVNLQKQEVIHIPYHDDPDLAYLHLNFTWSPINENFNAVLAVLGSFEYNIEIEQSGLNIYLVIQRFYGHIGSDILMDNTSGEWKSTSFLIEHTGGNWIKPNQDVYPIQLQLSVPNNQTYIRNLNLMLLVIDD